jgi:arsenate reductase
MAGGLLRARYGDRYDVFSAGTIQSKVSIRAIVVMQEIGIDISHHQSKTIASWGRESFDLAVTLL